MMDVVYLLGNGSHWLNNEIRYSLRSVQKHLKDFGQIHIVGEKPGFLNDKVKHIPIADKTLKIGNDISQYRPAYNTFSKLKAICSEDYGVSEKFLLMNDDFFFMKDHKACRCDIKYWYDRTLEEYMLDFQANVHTSYYKRIQLTLDYLRAKNLSTKRFSVHYPIVIVRKDFVDATADLDWTKGEYVTRTIYGNYIKAEGVQVDDCKTSDTELAESLPMFSSLGGVKMEIKHLLMKRFPYRSRYEK